MKKWLLHIIYMSVLSVLAVACDNSQMLPDGTMTNGEGKVHVTFTLSMGDNVRNTRAADETIGNSFDNRIDPENLQVLICDENNNLLAKVENLLYYQKEEINIYTFTGQFVADEAILGTSKSYKIMVFANCPTVNLGTDLATLSYEIPQQPSNNTLIPMWGVLQKDLVFAQGVTVDLGTIGILRAMAKVEVLLADELADQFILTGASFNQYNKSGYCLPAGYATDTNTANLSVESYFNPKSDESSQLLFRNVAGESNHLVTYVPEYENQGTLTIAVDITDIDGKEIPGLIRPEIEFKDYNSGTDKAFNVVRNHLYTFRIVKVGDTKLDTELQYQVMPWTDKKEADIEFN